MHSGQLKYNNATFCGVVSNFNGKNGPHSVGQCGSKGCPELRNVYASVYHAAISGIVDWNAITGLEWWNGIVRNGIVECIQQSERSLQHIL